MEPMGAGWGERKRDGRDRRCSMFDVEPGAIHIPPARAPLFVLNKPSRSPSRSETNRQPARPELSS